MAEADGVTAPDGGEAQGLGQEGLADTGGSHQQDVLVPVQELQGEDGVQEPSVQGDGGDQSKSSNRQVSSKPAARSRSSRRRSARRLTPGPRR